MNRTEVTITSDTNPNAKLVITRDAEGDIRIGATGAICIKANGSKVNSDVYESLQDIINAIEQDVPIGGTITVGGQRYTCREAPKGVEECVGCIFEQEHDTCCTLGVRCCGDERADGKDIIFE